MIERFGHEICKDTASEECHEFIHSYASRPDQATEGSNRQLSMLRDREIYAHAGLGEYQMASYLHAPSQLSQRP